MIESTCIVQVSIANNRKHKILVDLVLFVSLKVEDSGVYRSQGCSSV